MSWKRYYKVTGVRPGRIVTFRHGELDFRRDDIPLDVIQDLHEHDFPYLQLTEAGRRRICPDPEYNPTVKEVIQLIKDADSYEEAQEHAALKPESVTVQRELERKLKHS